jgi:enoyl-CoA hydratase/carnithine racemase
MLRYNIGNSNSETVLLSGKLFDSPEALKLGLVHELADQPKVLDLAKLRMQKMALNYCPAYGSLKRLLRRPLMDKAAREDVRSIKEWIKIWYSPETRAMAKEIKIY